MTSFKTPTTKHTFMSAIGYVLLAGLLTLSGFAQDEMAYLGVATRSADTALAKHFGLPEGVGLMVDHVVPGSAADGLFESHDLLHKLDGQLLTSPRHLAVLIRSKNPGDKIKVDLHRKGKELAVEAQLGRTAAKALPADRPNPLNFFMAGPNVGPLFDLGNIKDLEKQLEQDLGPAMNQFGGQLNELMQQGGDELFKGLGEGFKQLERQLADGDLDLGGAMLDGVLKMQANQLGQAGNVTSSVNINENGTNYNYTKDNDDAHFKATDADGNVLFDGDVNTDAERAKVPKDLQPMLEKLENSVGGGGIKLEFDVGQLGNNLNDNFGELFDQLQQLPAAPNMAWQFGIPGMPGRPGRNGAAAKAGNAEVPKRDRSHAPQDGTVRIIEDDLTLALSESDGKKHCKAVDADGNVIFDGPITTAEERKNLPAKVRDILNDLEGFE